MVSACIVIETSRVVVWEALWRAVLQQDGQGTDLLVAVAAVLRGRGGGWGTSGLPFSTVCCPQAASRPWSVGMKEP